MTPLFNLVAGILAAFYSAVPNYALAIILLTVLVMAITTPLTLKSTRSMMMMQQLQPEMKRIQARFKDDRQRANEEMLKFYKENNINPLGGCIPLLVQMPVFFFLYAVLRGLTRRVSDMGFSPGFTAGQNATGAALSVPPVDLLPFDPAYLDHSSAMYQSLSHTTTMAAPPLNIDLSESMTQAFSRGALAALPYIVLIAIVGFTSFYQQRQIQGRNPNSQVNPQTQTMMKIMPIILPVISLSLPAGLVLYFAVSNLWRVGLQGFISRSIYGLKRGEKPPGADVKAGTDKSPSGGGGAKAKRAGSAGGRNDRGKAATAVVDDDEPVTAGSGGGGSTSRSRSGGNGNGNARGRSNAKTANGKPANAKSGAGAGKATNGNGGATKGSATAAKSTNGSATNGKASAKNTNGNGSSSKARNGAGGSDDGGRSTAKDQESSNSTSASKSAGTGSETDSRSRGRNSGRTDPKKSSGTDRSTAGSKSPTQPSTPALQPRARRPKKR